MDVALAVCRILDGEAENRASGEESRAMTSEGGMQERVAGKLPEAEAVYLIGRLVEEQVVTLDNVYERFEGRDPSSLTTAEHAEAAAAVTASLMAVSMAVNHITGQVDYFGPALINAISTALYQYVQKVLLLLPSLRLRSMEVSFTASAPPAATLTLRLEP